MSYYTMYRVLCSTPPELEEERQLFESLNSRFAEQVLMPARILFPAASFPPHFDATSHRAAAESNVRMVDFFVQIYGAVRPAPAFQGFVDLALKCVADTAFPLRRACVLFPANADEELSTLKSALTANGSCEVREYGSRDDLEVQLRAMLDGWFAVVRDGSGVE